jgi:AcrR family transcriptional regulator
MGVKERRQRERTQIRERILDAALEVFATDGAEGVTMRALADAIEYTPPVIYAHFRDKDAIIEELCYRQLRAFAKAFASFGNLDPVERLRQIGYVYVDFATTNPSHFRFLFLQQHQYTKSDEEIGKDDPQQNAYAYLKQTAIEAVEAGLLRAEFTDGEEVAQMCWGAAHGVVALQNIKGKDSWIDWRDARTTARRLIDTTLNALVEGEPKQAAARAAAPRSRVRRKAR